MPAPNDNDILNADGAAKALGISKGLLLRLAREGIVPGKKLGREWRFLRSDLRSTLSSAAQVESAMTALQRAGVKFVRKPCRSQRRHDSPLGEMHIKEVNATGGPAIPWPRFPID